MPSFDPARRSLTLKFVYYGPSGAGKTASLNLLDQRIRRRVPGSHRLLCRRPGGLFCFDTLLDRTMFFDSLALAVHSGDERLLLRLVSVPGEAMHRHTRRLLLRGADGIMLVGDQGCQDSLSELRNNLRESGISADVIPVVAQPSPAGPEGAKLVTEALLSLVKAAWPSVAHTCQEASYSGFALHGFLTALSAALGDAPTESEAAKAPEVPAEPARPTGPPSSVSARRVTVVWDGDGAPSSHRVTS